MVGKMVLGAFLQGAGHHQSAWRHSSSNPRAEFVLDHYLRLAKIAEHGVFDAVFLADSSGWRDWDKRSLAYTSRASLFEPMTLLSALAVLTRRVGLVATVSTSYSNPFSVARAFASLDHLSGGRAGWNLVTSTTNSEARNFGLDVQREHDDRYRRAREFAQVVTGLWDCWGDDAVICDPESGIYFDPDKVRHLDFEGEFYKVLGPINLARSPQGRPIIVQAGSSDAGQELAAETAELVFTAQPDFQSAKTFYDNLKARMSNYGRDRDSLRILPGIFPIVAETEEKARRMHDEIDRLLHSAIGLAQLRDIFGGYDLSGFDLDGPLPEIPATQGNQSRREVYIEMARKDNLTIRQLFTQTAGTRGYVRLFGPPEMIADELERWFVSGAADGSNIMPSMLPRDLESFVAEVVPILQKRGLMHAAYRGETLRDHIGLARIDT